MRRLLILGSLSLLVACGGCKRDRFPPPFGTKGVSNGENGGGDDDPGPGSGTPRDDSKVVPVENPPGPWPHPRVMLSPQRLDKLKSVAKDDNPAFVRLREGCDAAVKEKIESGYEAEDWGHAAADLALCALLTGKEAYAKASVQYALALVDDKEKVGDKKGGDGIVKHNDGYSIRNRGVFPALVYDWLHENPALTADAKKKIVARVYTFLKWYRKDGYRNGDAVGNHYMGHFATAAVAGPAFAGDDPKGAELRGIARKMWKEEVVPAFTKKMVGGDFAEGWQYARTIAPSIAFHVDSESRAPGGNPRIADELPWLRETIAFQAHALHPDGGTMYDNADWNHKPARPSPGPFQALSLALPDQESQKRALSLARLTRKPDDPLWHWLETLADDPSRPEDDPRKGTPSHFAKGTGTLLARTDWSKQASWVSLTSSPFYEDHQHLDQGHFEVVRGQDLLIIDPGDYDSYSTMSHNSILVDDSKELMRKTPNQSIYGASTGMPRFEDGQKYVYGMASFGSAYDNDPDEKKPSAVPRAEREFFFSRGAFSIRSPGASRLVVYDRVTVHKANYGVTWTGHAGAQPKGSGGSVRIDVGSSSAQLTSLLPAQSAFKVLKEPTIKTDDIFMKNDPAEGIPGIRLETTSAKGTTERRFLHTVVVGAAGDALPPSEAVAGEGAEGARIDNEVYVFAQAAPQSAPQRIAYLAPSGPTAHFVIGLAPGGKYAVSAAQQGALCKVTVAPGGTSTASANGVLALTAQACTVK